MSIVPYLRRLCPFLMVLVPYIGLAQDESSAVSFGPTNTGKEFYFSLPTNYEDPSATQQYIRLYITSAVKTSVKISAGESFVKTLTTIPNGIVTWDLTKPEAQAVNRGNSDPIPDDAVLPNKAVHIVANDPIVLYVMNRTSFTSDGLMALPVNGLGQEYIIASATDAISGFQDYLLPSQYVIAAPYDSTEVTIVNAMDTPNHSAGDTVTITMSQGDVYSAMSSGEEGDLSGTYIRADRPIAVLAGENCTFLPDSRYSTCDHLVEMMLPVSSWGTVYHSMPYATRVKGDLYRIFAGADSANIYVNGILLTTLPNKGGARGIGWVDFLPPNRGPMEFRSDKPIYVAQYNNSQDYDGVKSDPFYCVLTPVEQYQKEFIFTTPSSDFKSNYINLVCDSLSFEGIEIALDGTDTFQKLGQLKGNDFKTFTSQIDGLSYVGKTFDIAPGTYRIRGSRPFAAYIYGYNSYDSYGYPLSAAVADQSAGDTTSPIIKQESTPDYGVRTVVIDGEIEVAGNTPLSTVDLDPVQSFNYGLEVEGFRPGISRTVSATLRVSDVESEARGVLVLCDMAGNCKRDTFLFSAVSAVPDNGESALAFTPSVLPNPLNGDEGTVRYSLRRDAHVVLSLHDPAGRKVRMLVEGRATPSGTHEESFSTSGLSAGTYYCRMTVDGEEYTMPVTIVR